jgi:hypothetical protein
VSVTEVGAIGVREAIDAKGAGEHLAGREQFSAVIDPQITASRRSPAPDQRTSGRDVPPVRGTPGTTRVP